MPDFSPTVLTVIRVGLQPYPHSEVSISRLLSNSVVLSRGSPIPMKTIFVSLLNSGRLLNWLSISFEVRLPWNPCFPVMQNIQPILHPDWDETHIVALSSSGI